MARIEGEIERGAAARIASLEGALEAAELRFAVVAARFNEPVTRPLADGAVETLLRHGAPQRAVVLVWVPGAFELPQAALHLAASGRYDAVVCVGAVLRGETPHFDFVAGEAARGIGDAARRTGVPITFGVLTTDTADEARARAGGERGNKGAEAAEAAIRMANLWRVLDGGTAPSR